MQYNTQREQLLMPEYGRGVQDMVEMAISLPDRAQRQRCAAAIVAVMRRVHTEQDNQDDMEQKLWNHLARVISSTSTIPWRSLPPRRSRPIRLRCIIR